MKVVGLTGGIGSGKTTVAKMFIALGVPVYIADDEARRLTNSSLIIKRKLTDLLGIKVYKNGVLNRKYVADIIFKDKDLLNKVNKIIHPIVSLHFKRWMKNQEGIYCIKEAAILFENDGYKKCDLTILVIAPVKERISRVLNRDGSTKKAIETRIKNQWNDDKKCKLTDIIIENIDLIKTKEKVREIHLFLSKI
ncbi:MAG: dephospho-CoA kinase [Bacteroidetes bacterium]|nr:dephospho-CoA kinase [Bacteroidota bacterium]